MIQIETIPVDEASDEVLSLMFEVLCRDFGVPEEAEWLNGEHGGMLAVARTENGGVAGVARLMPSVGEASRQVRHVAVAPHLRRVGVGRRLMSVLEEMAREEGAAEVWLNARDDAIAFYERLDFECEGDWFISEVTGIPHKLMRKAL